MAMNGILLIVGFYFIGELLALVFQAPIPGSIIGFLFALIFLSLKPNYLSLLKPGTEILLRFMPLFLTPVAVCMFFLVANGRNLVFFVAIVLLAFTSGVVVTALSMKIALRITHLLQKEW